MFFTAAEARELETEQEELRSGETLYLRLQKGVERDLPVELAELGPETVRIYVAPPSWEELERRLVGRGTEDMEKVRSRLARGREEFAAARDFDYFVINDTVDHAVDEIRAIMLSEHCRPGERMEMIGRGA